MPNGRTSTLLSSEVPLGTIEDEYNIITAPQPQSDHTQTTLGRPDVCFMGIARGNHQLTHEQVATVILLFTNQN